MAMYDLKINGKTHQVDVDPDTPILWVLQRPCQITWHQVRMWDRPVWLLYHTS